jgi:ABC-type multidrug transport system ATPase subunit
MADEPYVRVDGLGKQYGAAWATRNVTFEVKRGEIFGIIGPNGAGKTTTLKVLAGLLSPTEGGATAGGLRVDDPRHKRRIGYLPEESALYEDKSGYSSGRCPNVRNSERRTEQHEKHGERGGPRPSAPEREGSACSA